MFFASALILIDCSSQKYSNPCIN